VVVGGSDLHADVLDKRIEWSRICRTALQVLANEFPILPLWPAQVSEHAMARPHGGHTARGHSFGSSCAGGGGEHRRWETRARWRGLAVSCTSIPTRGPIPMCMFVCCIPSLWSVGGVCLAGALARGWRGQERTLTMSAVVTAALFHSPGTKLSQLVGRGRIARAAWIHSACCCFLVPFFVRGFLWVPCPCALCSSTYH
jgi:hypothetical protein